MNPLTSFNAFPSKHWQAAILGGLLSLILLASLAVPVMGVEIVDVRWEPDISAIHILLDVWPGNWGSWRFFLGLTQGTR